MSFDVDNPGALLDALDRGQQSAPLPPALAELVAHALHVRRWGPLCAASRGLRVYQRIALEDGLPVSSAITEALRDVRAAMNELRAKGGTHG